MPGTQHAAPHPAPRRLFSSFAPLPQKLFQLRRELPGQWPHGSRRYLRRCLRFGDRLATQQPDHQRRRPNACLDVLLFHTCTYLLLRQLRFRVAWEIQKHDSTNMRHNAPPSSYIKVVCRQWPLSYAPPGVLRGCDDKVLGLFVFFDPAKDERRREALRLALAVAGTLATEYGRHAIVSEWNARSLSCDLIRGVSPDRAARAA